MDWLVQNWVYVLVFAAFIGMHLFGHGGHGGHGGRGAMAVMEAVVAGAINAQQAGNNRARIGRKVINTEDGQSC